VCGRPCPTPRPSTSGDEPAESVVERESATPTGEWAPQEKSYRPIRCAFSHPAGIAVGAESALFATEGHQALMMTILTAQPQEIIFQATALEEVIEFLLNVESQALPLIFRESVGIRVCLNLFPRLQNGPAESRVKSNCPDSVIT